MSLFTIARVSRTVGGAIVVDLAGAGVESIGLAVASLSAVFGGFVGAIGAGESLAAFGGTGGRGGAITGVLGGGLRTAFQAKKRGTERPAFPLVLSHLGRICLGGCNRNIEMEHIFAYPKFGVEGNGWVIFEVCLDENDIGRSHCRDLLEFLD